MSFGVGWCVVVWIFCVMLSWENVGVRFMGKDFWVVYCYCERYFVIVGLLVMV